MHFEWTDYFLLTLIFRPLRWTVQPIEEKKLVSVKILNKALIFDQLPCVIILFGLNNYFLKLTTKRSWHFFKKGLFLRHGQHLGLTSRPYANGQCFRHISSKLPQIFCNKCFVERRRKKYILCLNLLIYWQFHDH